MVTIVSNVSGVSTSGIRTFSCCVSLGFYVQAFFQNVVLFAYQSVTSLLENNKHCKYYLKLNKEAIADRVTE